MITVLFEMTVEEARMVRDVMRLVGGPPKKTRRGLADAVHNRLDPFLGAAPLPIGDVKGAIYFTTSPRGSSIFERDVDAQLAATEYKASRPVEGLGHDSRLPDADECELCDDPCECAGCRGDCEDGVCQ